MPYAAKKKGNARIELSIRGFPFYPHDHISGTLCPRGDIHALVQAGLLTYGSSYLPCLPIFFKNRQ